MDAVPLSHEGDEIHLVREIVRTYQALMAGFSRKVGIPASRFAVMRLLATADADLGVMELARQLGINAAAVTRQVKEMEKEGLALRRADPRDGRRSAVYLSPQGVAMFEAMHARGHELERALARGIGSEAMMTTLAVLKKLRSIIESPGEEGS